MAGIKQRREDQRTDSSVDDLNALAQLHVAQHSNGAEVYVISEATVYTLVKGIGTLENKPTIVAPIAGAPSAGGKGDRWFANPAGPVDVAAFCEQADWFIDPLNGNDENDGLTAATALKTHEEVRRRVDKCVIEQSTTVHLLNDFDDSNEVLVDFILGINGFLTYRGEKPSTILYSGAFTSVIPTNPTGNVQLQVTDTAIPGDWGPANLLNSTADFRRIRITASSNPSRVGGISYPTTNTAPKTARTSQFKVPRTQLNVVSGGPPFDPLVGDQFVVETGLVTIASLVVDSTISAEISSARILFSNVQLSGLPTRWHAISMVANGDNSKFAAFEFSGCNTGHAGPANDTTVQFDVCKIGETPRFGDLQISYGSVFLDACLVVRQLQLLGAEQSKIGGKTLFDLGANLVVSHSRLTLNETGIFDTLDVGGNAILVSAGGVILAAPTEDGSTSAYGTGHDRAVSLSATASFVFQAAKPTITGATADVVVSGVAAPTWATFGNNFTDIASLATVSSL